MEISRDILTQVTILDISLILMYIIGVFVLAQKFRSISVKFIRLFMLIGIAHLLFTFVYYFYTLGDVADTIGYYRRVMYQYDSWGETFGQGTTFIYFTLYPLVKYIGLTYFGSFFVYSFFGLLGYYYLLKILIKISDESWSPWFYLLLMPNIHFWTVAIGKDSLIFFGISLLAYIYFLNKKWYYYILPVLLIGFVRLHILILIILALGFALLFLNKKIKTFYKVIFAFFTIATVYLLFPLLISRLGFSMDESLFDQLEMLENKKMLGGSSVNLVGENIFIKWFSYVFRPFFFDSHNSFTLISSFENSIWVVLFIVLFKNFRKKLQEQFRHIYWFTFFAIFTITIPSAFILINLGIAVRQKTMVIPFLFMVFFLTIFKLEKIK